MAITMDDSARGAKVPVSTVSRVINNTKPVSAEVRERVYAIIEKNHFKPSEFAYV